MIGRGAEERQAQRDVHAAVEIQRLDRDQRLVVVHADRGVVPAARGGVEHRVGGQRSAQVHAFAAQPVQHRNDHLDFLAADLAAFARMRVQPRHGQPWRGQAELRDQRRMGDADARLEQFGRERGGHLGQRDVNGRRHHAQLVRGQHHHHLGHPGQMGEVFRMAGKGEARAVLQGLLVDR